MRKALLSVLLAWTLVSCSTTSIVGGIAAFKTAPVAHSILKDYIGEDEQANTQLAPQLIALQTLYDKAREVDSKQSFLQFYDDHGWQVTQARAHWKAVLIIVGSYAQRTGRPIPQELEIFRIDVETAYQEFGNVIAEQRRDKEMGKYVDLLGLLVKLGAASQGVII